MLKKRPPEDPGGTGLPATVKAGLAAHVLNDFHESLKNISQNHSHETAIYGNITCTADLPSPCSQPLNRTA